MSKVAASQGRPCTMWLELEPAAGQVVPDGFTYHIEWLGPDGEPAFLLTTREHAQQTREGNRIYLDVDIPSDAPVGLYDPTRFEMRFGAGDHRRVREENVDEIPLPSIEISAGASPQVPWPRVKGSG
jgi:hypothetical protein